MQTPSYTRCIISVSLKVILLMGGGDSPFEVNIQIPKLVREFLIKINTR